MKLRRAIAVSGLMLMCATQAQCMLGRGLSTPDERAEVVALTRLLERNPSVENAGATRQWLRAWIVAVPDIHVFACEDLLGHGLGDTYPYAREVNLQALFSAAAFAIEHPDQARDESAQYYAGVQGALSMYEVLAKSQPDAKSPFLDDFLAKRNRGELADYVAKLASEKCQKLDTVLISHVGGAGVGLILGLLVAWQFGSRRAPVLTGLSGVTEENGSSRPPRVRQWVVFVCGAYYVIVVTALHILEPGFDPRFRFLSEYALGRYGWLMTTTFFVLGLAICAVATALRDVQQGSRGVRFGFGLLTVAALFVCLAGVFKDSMPHLLASAVFFPSIVIAVLILSWSFRRAAGWQATYRATLFIALGMLAAFLSLLADVPMPGLQQRAFIFLLLAWLSIVIRRSVQVRTRSV